MIIDFQQSDSVGDFLTFPDWPFDAVPQANVGENVILLAASACADGTIRLEGNPDQQE